MSPRRLLSPAFAIVLALGLAACGISAKPEAGTLKAIAKNHKGVDDPRTIHVQCLRSDNIPVTEFGRIWMQVGSKPTGPTIQFTPTAGAAQEDQIDGQVEGAEVIGSALLYPNQASDALLAKVEGCVAEGVTG